MKPSFQKQHFNKDFDHQERIKSLFSELGFNDIDITTSTKNGLSHYVAINDFVVINEMKLFAEMFVFEGMTCITVRISDHKSNLDTICGGVSGNKMNLQAFKKLIETGAIAPKNLDR